MNKKILFYKYSGEFTALLLFIFLQAGCSGSSSGSSGSNSAPGASNVQISGTAVRGEVLTGSYTYSDPEGDPEGASTFRWLRSDTTDGTYTAITGAAGLTYTLVSGDKLKFIRFEVTPVAHSGTGTGSAVVSGSVGAVTGFWTHPAGLTDNVSPDGQNAYSPQISMDNNGNALIVWYQSDSANNQVFMSEYRNGAWTHPTGLTDNISPDGQNAFGPQASMDNYGNAFIVWQQLDGVNYQIFMSEYRNGAWTHPTGLTDNISPDGEHTWSPRVSIDNNGNALIVWTQSDGFNEQIFMSEYRNGSWTHPSDLNDNISPNGQDVSQPQVLMDNSGNALIVWTQSDSANYQIFMSEYRNGAWTHPADLTDNISPNLQNAGDPQISMDNNGNALIVWSQFDGVNSQIFMSEYRNGSWTHPSDLSDSISPDGMGASYPQASMDNNGNDLIVWHQFDNPNFQIFKSEYRNGSWIHPTSLTDNISPNGQHAYEPRVFMDNKGNALIVWYQSDGLNDQLFISEYRKGSWTHPTGLTDNITPDGQDIFSPQVSMDDNGNAIIVWEQSDNSDSQIFMSEYR